ncbi:hypothetical protein [Hansschlegelia beijingensis]|uniref:Uncharacterized protein n=1 Tax=Hansschlegelia beijingensis TaxID=1133344 RepID=A0A7W6GGS7_9HYPH|nr:hypothetical protein [Hansschlegelia beijingensis]MBB3974630.1 hypothetical protein [Hansschlegelia beijingensis]
MTMHAFQVGTQAHFIGSPLGPKPQPAEVVACLPPENGQPGYRVKCLDDGHLRHVSESELVLEPGK